jgi:hypothetical protein
MTRMIWTAGAVENFLAADKTLVGDGGWTCDLYEEACRLVFSLAVNGEISGHTFEITHFPLKANLEFTMIVNVPPVIMRLDYDPPTQLHVNEVGNMDECQVSVYGPHVHLWRLNKHRIRQGKLPDTLPRALPLPSAIKTFDAALNWFCAEANIFPSKGQIPALPPRGKLI